MKKVILCDVTDYKSSLLNLGTALREIKSLAYEIPEFIVTMTPKSLYDVILKKKIQIYLREIFINIYKILIIFIFLLI